MLRIYRASGDLLVSLTKEELQSLAGAERCPAKLLKRHLQTLCGQNRFKQKLLRDGTVIADDAIVEFPGELQLILVPASKTAKDGEKALIKAAAKGDVDAVEGILHLPQDPDAILKDGRTALAAAADGGHVEVAEVLLEAGADADLTGKDGKTPLLHAAAGRSQHLVQLLLNARANPNVLSSEAYCSGETPLILAISEADVEDQARLQMVMSLLTARADTNLCGTDCKSALMYASEAGELDIVNALLGARADVEKACARRLADTRGGSTPLHRAALRGHGQIASQLLAARADIDKADFQGSSPLLIAASYAKADIVRLLLDARADHTKEDFDGQSPHRVATWLGHTSVARMLQELPEVPKRDGKPAKRVRLTQKSPRGGK